MAESANLYDLLVGHRLETPNAPALRGADGTVTSYGDLDRMSASLATVLQQNGCGPGDWVAVSAEKSRESLALYLACLRAGCVYLPLNTAYRPAEFTYFLADAAPRVLVCDPALAAQLEAPAKAAGIARTFTLASDGRGSLSDAAATAGSAFAPVARSDEDIAVVLYTSGTTGRPKGATISVRAIRHCALTLGGLWEFSRNDVLLHALPIFHGHGLFVACNVALAAGASMIFQPRFDLTALLAALPRATVMMGVPTFYTRILADTRFDSDSFRHLRLVTCGSAPLPPEQQAQFAARFGQDIVQRYGTTETMILTSNPVRGERRPGSVGQALPGVGLRIADRNDVPLPDGEIGMIEVRGPGLFSGYWRMPEKTAEEFTADGWFRTGDLGVRTADGYVNVTGRAKDLVISGGYNVYPAEVEAVLDAYPGVAESAVIGTPHPDFGEAVTAVVVASTAAPALSAEALMAHAKAQLANYKVPKQIVFIAELPRNSLGKVQKNVLREQLAQGLIGPNLG